MRKPYTIILIFALVICLSANIYAEEIDTMLAKKDQPWFGFIVENSIEKKVEEIPNGALIKDVIVGSNAEKMGLVKKDIVKKVGDVEVTSVATFLDEVFKKKPGEEVTLVVFRSGESIDVTFSLEDFQKRADGALEALGFTAKSFNIDDVEGIVVAEVTAESYADYGGLLVNDLIMAMDHHDFKNLVEFEMILSDLDLEKPVDIMVIRSVDNQQKLVPLKVGKEVEATDEEADDESASKEVPVSPGDVKNPHK